MAEIIKRLITVAIAQAICTSIQGGAHDSDYTTSRRPTGDTFNVGAVSHQAPP
jgi:hypothetical protein